MNAKHGRGSAKYLLIALALLGTLWLALDLHAGTTIRVPQDYATIQEAINVAVNGDTIVIDQGVYYENGLDFLGKAITIRSTDPADPLVVAATIIDADGQETIFSFASGEGRDTVLDGLTLTGAVGPTVVVDGASPTISHCRIESQRGTEEAALTLRNGASPLVKNVAFKLEPPPLTVLITDPPDGYLTAQTSVTVSGTVDNPAATVLVNEIPAIVNGDTFTATNVPLLENADTTITAAAADGDGNEASHSISVSNDAIPPAVSILTPAAGQVIGGSAVQVTGMVTDTHTVISVTVNGVLASLNGETFSALVSLESGAQVLNAIAADEVGHEGVASRMVAVDGDGPMIDIHAPAAGQAIYTLTPTVAISYTDFFTAVDVNSLSVLLIDPDGVPTDITNELAITESGAQGTVNNPLLEDASYSLAVSLADTFGNTGNASSPFYVPAAPGNVIPPPAAEDAGWVSGVIYDSTTCDEHLTACQGLAGVQVTLAGIDTGALAQVRAARQQQLAAAGYRTPLPPLTDISFTSPLTGTIITGPDGFFAFPVAETGVYWLRAEKDGYTYGQREAEIVREHSEATNAIYLSPIDPAMTLCDEHGCLHDSSDGLLQVEIPPGAIPPGEVVTTTATYFEQVEFLPSGELPEGTWETYAFNLGGDSEFVFESGTQATVRIANTLGFAPGTAIPLGYWNQATQAWEHAGTGIVDPSGQWVETQVTHFSNYDCNDPLAPLQDTNPYVDDESDDDENECGEGENGCFINLKSGTFEEEVALPTVNVLGEQVAPTLLYSSEYANPGEIIDLKLSLDVGPGDDLGDYIGFELYIEGQKTDNFVFSNTLQTGEMGRYRYLWDGHDAQGNLLSPGVYEYAARFSIPYRAQYCYALNGIFGNPPDCVNGATGIFVDAVDEQWVRGTVELNTQTDSPFGAGWVLDGQQHLHEDEVGHILITDGRRNDEFYFPDKDLFFEPTGEYTLAWVNRTVDTLQTVPEQSARVWDEVDIPVGNLPESIALSADGALAYITNVSDDTVSVVDMVARQETAIIGAGDGPSGIALSPDGSVAYVTNSLGNTLSIIDLAIPQQIATIGVGNYPQGLAVSPDGAFAYVSNYNSHTLSVVDLVLQEVLTNVSVGSNPQNVALSPDGSFAYVVNTNSNTVSVVDLGLQQQTGTISVETGPVDIALSPDGVWAYVTNYDSNTLSVVDLNAQMAVATISTPSSPGKIALSADGAWAYVITGPPDYKMAVVDLTLQQVVATIGAGSDLRDVVLSPDGTTAYVVDAGGGSVSVVDLTVRQEITTLVVGEAPYDVALSSTGDVAYITNQADNTLAIADLTTNEVITVNVGSAPKGIALSLDGVFAYVVNAADDSVSVVDILSLQEVGAIGVGDNPVEIALSPDGAFAYVTNNGGQESLSVIDLALQQQVALIPLGGLQATDVAVSPDGAFAYVLDPPLSYGGTPIRVVDLNLRQVVDVFGVGAANLRDIAVSGDGFFAYVVHSSSREVFLIDLSTHEVVNTVSVGYAPSEIAILPDESFAYVSNWQDGTVSVLDLDTWQEVAVVRGDGDGPQGIALSSGESAGILSRAATDYSTLSFDPETATYTRVYLDGTQVHFNPDGTHDTTLEPDGRQAVYTYNPDGTVATMGIIPPGEETPRWTWTFNYVDGKLSSIIDPANRATDFTIDAQNHLTTVTTPDNAAQGFAYDARHLMTQYSDQNGAVTSHMYDSYGRITDIIEPPRAVYNPQSGQTEVVQEVRTFTPSDTGYTLINDSPVGDPDNPAPPVTTSDELVDSVAYGRGSRSGHSNKWGSWLDETDGEGRTTLFERDANNKMTRLDYADGDCVEYQYDNNGKILVEERIEASQCGLARAARDPAQVQSRLYTYEEQFNQVKTETDPLGNTTTYVYDYEAGVGDAGNLIRIQYPPVENELGQIVTPTVSYTYTALGLLETETDARGAMTRYIYTQGSPDEASGGNNPLFAPGVTPTPGLLTQIVQDFGGEGLTSTYQEFDGAGNPGVMMGPGGHLTTTFTYDGLNRPLSQTDAVGIVTRYEYDGRGNLVRQTVDYTPDGITGRNVVTEYAYNAHGQRLNQRTAADGLVVQTSPVYDINRQPAVTEDGRGNQTIYLYDDADQLVNVIDPAGHLITYTYALDGQLQRVTDADGYVTRYVYDGLGRLLSEIQDEGGLNLTTSTSYDLNDNLLTMTDAVGTVTCYEYDSLNRRTAEIEDCGGRDLTTTYAYDVNGNIVYQTDPRGATTFFAYDALNRNTLVRLDDGGLNLETGYVFDAAGNLAQMTDERGIITSYAYDDLNRLTQSCQDALGLNLCTSYTYDRLHNQETVTDANGLTTRTAYNAFGQPQQVTVDDGGLAVTTSYTYDNALNLTRISDANGNATLYTYTPRNLLASETYADGTVVAYGYDGRGNREEVTNQDDETITNTYDGAGRQMQSTFSTGGEQSFAYDAANRLLSAAESMPGHDSLLTYAYNPLGDVVSSTQTLDGMSWSVGYQYDYVGGIYTTTYPSGVERVHSLDALGRPGAVQQGDGSVIADYSFDDVNSTFGVTYANDLTNQTDYDALRRTTRVSSAVADYGYGYDDASNRTYMQRLHQPGQPADVYQYDNLYQLTQVWYGADATNPDDITSYDHLQWYELDNVGNRLEVQNDGNSQVYLPNDGQQLTNPMNRYEQVDANPFAYDLRGNTLTDGVNSYGYDILNRQMSMIGPGGTAAYVYDAFGRRIAKVVDGVTTHYVYDMRYRVIEERDGNGGLLARYTYGFGIDEPLTMERDGNTYYYHRDAQTSVTEVTDSAGALVERYEYDVYGAPSMFDNAGMPLTDSAIGNPYLYTGRRYEPESGNYYFRARYYDPAVGRFLSHDPVGFGAGDANLYRYVFNRPVRFTDPMGLAWYEWGVWEWDGLWNAVDVADQAAAGVSDSLTMGGTTRVREWVYGDVATRNHEGAVFTGGQIAGAGMSFMMGYGATNSANAGVWAARAARAARAYTTATTVGAAGISAYHAFDPCTPFTGWDALNFVPVAGYATRNLNFNSIGAGFGHAKRPWRILGNEWNLLRNSRLRTPYTWRNFVSDRRISSQVRAQYWRASGGADKKSLQHLWVRNSNAPLPKWLEGFRNSGLNLMELPLDLNRWAGGRPSRELAIRLGVGGLAGASAGGGFAAGQNIVGSDCDCR